MPPQPKTEDLILAELEALRALAESQEARLQMIEALMTDMLILTAGSARDRIRAARRARRLP